MTTKIHNTHSKFASLSSALICAALLSACPSQETTRTGFLNTYDHMRIAEDDKDALVYKAPAKMAYTRFMVDEVTYAPGQKSEKDVTPEQIAEIKKSYQDAAIKTFSKRYQYTNQPDYGVMRVRLAITGIDKANSTLNYVTVALVGPVSNGGASSESEVIDAMTGEKIAALATHTNADPINGGVFEYFTKTGHAKSVLADHAEQLRVLADNSQQQNIR